MRDRIRVGHLEPALLQILAVIEQGTADKERAFGIDHYADIRTFDHDIAVGRSIDQIHFVLQSRTTASNDRDPQCTARASLLVQKR